MKDKYIINRSVLLGEGAFGSVFEGRCKSNGQLCAIKEIDLKNSRGKIQDGEKTKFQSEMTLLSSLKHPGIIKLYSIYQDTENVFFQFFSINTKSIRI